MNKQSKHQNKAISSTTSLIELINKDCLTINKAMNSRKKKKGIYFGINWAAGGRTEYGESEEPKSSGSRRPPVRTENRRTEDSKVEGEVNFRGGGGRLKNREVNFRDFELGFVYGGNRV